MSFVLGFFYLFLIYRLNSAHAFNKAITYSYISEISARAVNKFHEGFLFPYLTVILLLFQYYLLNWNKT